MHAAGARLRDVCFVHWPVDPDALATRLPRALSVATFEGTAWVSLLASRTRLIVGPLPVPGEFSQVAVRTYVRAADDDAVYFLRVDVDGHLVAAGARTIFGLPFVHADASVTVEADEVRVRSLAPGGTTLFDATFERSNGTTAEDDSVIGWLTERSTDALDDGRTGVVDHEPWALARTDVDLRTDEVLAAEGLAARIGEPLFRYGPGAAFRLRSWPSRSPDGAGSS